MSNYLTTLLDALTSGYSRKDLRNANNNLPMETNIGRLFSVFAWGMQIIDDQSVKILLWDDIDKAQGVVLDRYGANFGVRRNGSSDEFYRLLIKVKMISMISGGDIDTVINAVVALFDVPPESVDLQEIYPAKIGITVDGDLLNNEKINTSGLVARLIKRILVAGVGMELKITFAPGAWTNEETFRFINLTIHLAVQEGSARVKGATFNGAKCFDGSFTWESSYQGLGFPRMMITGLRVKQEYNFTGKVTLDTRWYFDGTYSFDGTKTFNAGIEEVAL